MAVSSWLFEKRPLKRAKLGPPDVYPQDPKQKEVFKVIIKEISHIYLFTIHSLLCLSLRNWGNVSSFKISYKYSYLNRFIAIKSQ